MAAKFVVVLAMSAVAHSSVVPLVRTDGSSFAYDVADPNTGDYKSQAETRVGDTVRGQYSLLQPDGTQRIVDYTAGDEGFNALVRNEPAVLAPAPVVATAAAAAAPAPAEPVVLAARSYQPYNAYLGSSVYTPNAAFAGRSLLRPAVYNGLGPYGAYGTRIAPYW